MSSRSLICFCFAIVILLQLAVSTSLHAQPPPKFPEAFYGAVQVNGQVAQDGTTVTAQVEGFTYGLTTTSGGNYSLTVFGPVENATILFYVSGVKADQTARFQSSVILHLNLTATVPNVLVSVTPSYLILRQGENGLVQLHVTPLFGSFASALVYVLGIPKNSGITSSATPNPTNAPPDVTSNVTISIVVNSTAQVGIYLINIGIISGSIQRQALFPLAIIEAPPNLGANNNPNPPLGELLLFGVFVAIPPLAILLLLRWKRRTIPYL